MSINETDGLVTVSADSSAPYVANIQASGQKMTIDETGVVQGLKIGADPYDYILSALGACTVITLHMYAQRKGWPLERAEVSLRHERLHRNDCVACEDAQAKLDHIWKNLRLIGDLTPDQRKRLELISSKCPVQKTLEAGITVQTTLDIS
ncbi:OsmC family protein [Pontibacter rugosus]|uniref:OsmC family protein n=1 Tax=Pontibacter rugosus TaxID=1745966 RepID=A0ABW3STL8_9BACT